MLLHDFTRSTARRGRPRRRSSCCSCSTRRCSSSGALALVLFALARERPRVALAVVAVMALAPFTRRAAQAAARAPARAHRQARRSAPRRGRAGTRRAATALALSAVLVAPAALARARRSALGGASSRWPSASSLLIRAWHMPSDVLGGYLLAASSGWRSPSPRCARPSARWPRRRDGRPALRRLTPRREPPRPDRAGSPG